MSNILKIIFANKKSLILIFSLVLFLSLIPWGSAQATHWWEYPGLIFTYVITLPIRIAALFVAIPLAIIALVTWVLYSIIVVLLGWLKEIALTVPITPEGVHVVAVGWNITRNLANMGLILILVFIGLATILRIKEYEAKKLLPVLIIVALLINFSPVLVGFIVDISNIIANFFLGLSDWENIGEAFLMVVNYFGRVTTILTAFDDVWAIIGHIIGIIILGVVLIAFFGYSAWIYLLVVALFIVRIIVLWILMILAPFAFLFYVLPAGRKLAMEWWQQLVQWSIIGIPIGFFLFLSFEIMEAATRIQVQGFFRADALKGDVKTFQPGGGFDFGDFTIELANALGVMLVPLVSVVMLHIGYKLSRRYMPAAANQIIGGVEKGFKMAAGAALVAATGGAAAGLAVKGLGGLAKGAKGIEELAGRVPKVGGALKWGMKPASWATRGIERAAAPTLLEYQAKTRKVPDKDLEKIDKMAPAEAEAYINAKTKILPEGLKKQQKLQYMARMADKETLEYTSSNFQNEAKTARKDIFEKENPHFQKEAHSIAKSLGDMEEEEFVHSKLVGMPNKTHDDKRARKEKEAKIRDEIKTTQEIIQSRIGKENLTIEAALQLKYVTKNEVKRGVALDKIREIKALDDNKRKKIEENERNIAASATFTKELKPEDIRKTADPKNLATRVGITLGNPRNLQKIQDNFGMEVVKDMIEGPGGINDATNTPDKLKRYAKEENPRMARALFTSPAYREIDFAGRHQMVDLKGQPTTNFNDFERTL